MKKYCSSNMFDKIVMAVGMMIIVVVAYPLVYAVSASFSDPETIFTGEMWLFPKGFNLNAYKEVFKSRDIFIGYKNTVIYAVTGTVINVVATTMAAYPLSRPDLAGRNGITFFLTFTLFFGGGMIPTYLTIQSLNMVDTFWVMVVPGAVSVTNMIIMRNFFKHSIPGELIEAAYVDGCSNIGNMLRVVLPLSKSILAVMVIFYFVGHWNSYFDALMYLSDKSRYPLQVFLRQILVQNQPGDIIGGTGSTDSAQLQLLFETLKYAVILVSSLPVLLLYPLMQKHFVKGIMIGSVKG